MCASLRAFVCVSLPAYVIVYVFVFVFVRVCSACVCVHSCLRGCVCVLRVCVYIRVCEGACVFFVG